MEKVTQDNYYSNEMAQIYTGSSEIKRVYAMRSSHLSEIARRVG